MSTPTHGSRRRRYIIPVVAIAAVGAAGGAVVLSGCGDSASAGSTAASVAGYIPASSPVYVQVSTDTTGAQWTQLIDLAQMFPSYGTMEKRLQADLAREGISWEKDLRPLLGEAAALATTKMPDTAAVTKGGLTDPAGAAGRALAAAADQPVLAVMQIAEGKSDQVKALLADPGNGGLKSTGDYNGATLLAAPTGGMHAAVTADALIIGSSEAVVKQAIDAHAAGGDQALSGVFRFNDALALLPKDVFAMAYVNLEEMGKGALSGIPQVENLVGGQITGAAAMSVTAQPDGLHMKAVLVDTPPMADQKAYTPTLMKNAPADSVAYLGFNRLADTVQQVLQSAESSSSPDTKKQIDAVLAQAPLLLGVNGADLKNLAGGEHAVVVTGGQSTPAVSLALQTGDGAQATSTLTSLSKAVPALMSQFGGAKGTAKGFVAVDLNGVKGQQLSIGKTGNVVWGVKGNLAVIGSRAGAVASVLAPKTGATLADSKAFQDATQGMPDQVTGLAWVNVPEVMTLMAANGAFTGKNGAQHRESLSHVSGIAAWGTQGDNPTIEVFLGLKK
ncbi:MAG: DUF3352 domain-containing protein [Thermoleophilia bacterium]